MERERPVKSIQKPRKKRKNFDSPWKEALDIFFKDFVMFCFPKMAAEIDWSKDYVFLDKELHAITKDAATGQRTVDKLVKVFKQGGEEVWVLIHMEVQGKGEKSFPERMYTYQYRIFDHYHVPVVSIAILIDGDKTWVPNAYQSSLWGTELYFRYQVLKVLSYEADRASLENSSNPFATVLLAQLEATALSKELDQEQHLVSKLKLTRLLYEKGWGRENICHLFRFIDWIIQLPTDLVLQYDQKIHEMEEEKKMTYVTSIERLGIERGKQIGLELGKAEGETAGEAKIVQNIYQAIQDEKQVAKLTKLSLKKVKEILGRNKTQKD